MPQAGPLLGSIAVNLAIGAVAAGVSLLLKPKTTAAPPTVRQTTTRGMSFDVVVGEQVPVSSIYGQARQTDPFLIFAQEYGDNNEFAKFVFVNGKGWYDSDPGQVTIDEKLRSLSGSNDDVDGRVVDDYVVSGTPYLWIKTYDGRPGQTADAGLIAAASTRWTNNHTVTGTPYTIITMRQNADVFGSVLPKFGFIRKGLRQYDWRHDSTMPGGSGAQRWDDASTWSWSENPAVLKWNYRRGLWINGVRVLGLGFSRYAQDLAYYTAAANLSDEGLYYGDTDRTLARYAYGREIADGEDPMAVLREFDDAMCGTSFDRGGADAPLPGQQLVSAMTLEDKRLISGRSVTKDLYGTVSAKKTAYHGSFVSAADGWIAKPFGTRINTDLETAIGGRKSEQLDQPYEHEIERAQMRAEVALRRNLFPATRTETFGPRSNPIEVGDAITRATEDWGSILAVVGEVGPNASRTENIIVWSQWDNSIIPTTGEGFIALPPAAGASPVPPDRTLAVSTLNVVPVDRVSGHTTLPYATATWAQISDPNVDQVMIRYWPDDGTDEADGVSVFASARLQHTRTFGPLDPLTDYTGYAIPVRRDALTCVPTNPFHFTSGAMVAGEVAADTIDIEQLVQELKNAYGIITTSTPGSVIDQLEQLAADVGELADAVTTGDQTHRKRISTLIAQTQTSKAAVLRNEEAIAEETAARATAIQEVVASLATIIAENLADGYLKLQADVDTVHAIASVLMKVKAVAGELVSTAAAELRASVNRDTGVLEAIFIVLGKLYVALPGGDGTVIPAIETLDDGTVKFVGTRMGRIDSLDGHSYIDFEPVGGGIDIYSESA